MIPELVLLLDIDHSRPRILEEALDLGIGLLVGLPGVDTGGDDSLHQSETLHDSFALRLLNKYEVDDLGLEFVGQRFELTQLGVELGQGRVAHTR